MLNSNHARRIIGGYEHDLIAIRHDLHRYPETGFNEHRTSDVVANLLSSYGLTVHRGIARTGLVATLPGRTPGGRTIALRADMDALPIVEANDFEYASRHEGCMHACGHDGHTTMLLGAARYLSEHNDFAGRVLFVFQPAEESLGGARVMIEDGLLERFPCDAIYAMHNFPSLPAGHFAIRTGPMMAASDTWSVTFEGTGGHGGVGVHRGTDPISPAAQFIASVQTIVGRNVAPCDAAVVSVGHIAAGSAEAPNVIPRRVHIAGTARSFLTETRAELERRLGELAHGTASAFACAADYKYHRRYPPLVNHPREARLAAAAAAAVAGEDQVGADAALFTGGEDFAFFLEKVPGAYIFIGNDGVDSSAGLHSSRYDFNDDILTVGARYFVEVVQRELGASS
jgi:amidohydrolase